MNTAPGNGRIVCAIADLNTPGTAVPIGARLACDLRSRALLVHVIDNEHGLASALRAAPWGKPRGRRRKLLALAEQHHFPNRTGVRIETGDPLTTLLTVAEQEDAQLIVVAARGSRRGAASLGGGVASGLMHHAPCPVVVVPAAASAPLDLPRMRDVVCGVQGNDPQTDLRVLKVAGRLSTRLRGELHAVHGYKPPAWPADTPGPQRRLNDTLKRAGIEARANALPLPAAEALERVADQRRARLIVVGPRRHGRDLHGSVTTRLAAQGRRPLVVVPMTQSPKPAAATTN